MSTTMQQYELLYILPAKYTEEELKTMTTTVAGLVTAAGGTVSATHVLGRRKMEYPIRNIRQAEYCLAYFEAEPAHTNKLNDTLRHSPDVVRHLIVKRDMRIVALPVYREVEEQKYVKEEVVERPKAPAPTATQSDKPSMTMEELDKKLDEILTEEVV